MLIDVFTTIAQIINFLILVFLLKKFLYKPIVKAMEQREQRITLRLEEADNKLKLAEQEAEIYQEKQKAIDAIKENLLNNIKLEVEEERKVLLKNLRQEIELNRNQWLDALEKEKEAFWIVIRQKLGERIISISRQVLMDIANVTLEEQIIKVFIENLKRLDEGQVEAIRSAAAINPQPSGIAVSSFPLSQEAAENLQVTINQLLGSDYQCKLEYQQSPEIICGIELNILGNKIAWNIKDYLITLEDNLATVLAKKSPDSDNKP